MIRHLYKVIWNQRRQNGWIFLELLLVFIALWLIIDMFIVEIYSYNRPLGYNVENCWRLNFDNYTPDAPEYVSDTTLQVNETEALQRIMERLRRCPEIEEVCMAFYSSPYSNGNTWRDIRPYSTDSVKFQEVSFHCYHATPEFFRVFRIRDEADNDLMETARKCQEGVFLTPEMEASFFSGSPAVGKQVFMKGNKSNLMTVGAIVNSIREDDFKKPSAAFYKIIGNQSFPEYLSMGGARAMEVSVRMKKAYTEDEMQAFLSSISSQLSEGNLYINAVNSWEERRESVLKGNFQMQGIRILLTLFVLVNVFFGVTGTFWLRIEQRRSETGLRMALGSTRKGIGWLLTGEGWLLLITAIPVVLLVIFNLYYMEVPDLYNLPFTWWRVVLGLGGALVLMGGMIALGVWLPARRAMKMQPAEALHYE